MMLKTDGTITSKPEEEKTFSTTQNKWFLFMMVTLKESVRLWCPIRVVRFTDWPDDSICCLIVIARESVSMTGRVIACCIE